MFAYAKLGKNIKPKKKSAKKAPYKFWQRKVESYGADRSVGSRFTVDFNTRQRVPFSDRGDIPGYRQISQHYGTGSDFTQYTEWKKLANPNMARYAAGVKKPAKKRASKKRK